MLRGELVNKSCREEPVCLKCSEGLVNKDCKREPVCLNCSEWLVNANNRREPVCLKCSEGLVIVSNWVLGAVALGTFKPGGDVALAGLTPKAAWPVQG